MVARLHSQGRPLAIGVTHTIAPPGCFLCTLSPYVCLFVPINRTPILPHSSRSRSLFLSVTSVCGWPEKKELIFLSPCLVCDPFLSVHGVSGCIHGASKIS